MNISNAIAYNSTAYSFNTLINKVFIWIGIGTLTSGILSCWFDINSSMLSMPVTTSGMKALRYLAVSPPDAFVLLMFFELNHFSFIALLILFFVIGRNDYSILDK